ncbi:MAG: NADH-quinone oxidoreductase subunit H [Spirochaetales bacterium]
MMYIPALLLAPLLFGIIGKTKALVAGRKGAPFLQPYWDIMKLIQKGAVYSKTTSLIFRISPVLGFAATLTCFLLLPIPGYRALLSFPGDFLALVLLLGVARFSMVLAALDTGSSFEGMGASREVFYSFLAEPTLLLTFLVLLFSRSGSSLAEVLTFTSYQEPGSWVTLALVSLSIFIVLLAENARIPFDDPNTHLELTMIHEVMVLDTSGPDFAFVTYTAALKLWIFGTVWLGITFPFSRGLPWLDLSLYLLGMVLFAFLIGIIESILARVRLLHTSHPLTLATVLSALALLWTIG